MTVPLKTQPDQSKTPRVGRTPTAARWKHTADKPALAVASIDVIHIRRLSEEFILIGRLLSDDPNRTNAR